MSPIILSDKSCGYYSHIHLQVPFKKRSQAKNLRYRPIFRKRPSTNGMSFKSSTNFSTDRIGISPSPTCIYRSIPPILSLSAIPSDSAIRIRAYSGFPPVPIRSTRISYLRRLITTILLLEGLPGLRETTSFIMKS